MEQASKTATIMVVDDEPVITHLVNRTLTRAGYHVIEVNDSTTAIGLIKAHNPDLILLDIRMPQISGLQLLERIREFSDVPVIMLTAVHELMALQKSFDTGADDYIEKPFLPGILAARVLAKLRMAKKQ